MLRIYKQQKSLEKLKPVISIVKFFSSQRKDRLVRIHQMALNSETILTNRKICGILILVMWYYVILVKETEMNLPDDML